MKSIRLCLFAFLFLLVFSAAVASAQSRDHLTPKEVELVQDTQFLDQRIEVFIRAIERRLMVMNGTEASNAKQLKKEAEIWGDLPKGSRAQLLSDIDHILEEAITNIDDVSTKDEKSPLLAKSVRKLAAEAMQLKTQLLPLRDQTKSEDELASLEHVLENGQSIIDATSKLTPMLPTTKEKKKSEKPKSDN